MEGLFLEKEPLCSNTK